MNSRIYFYKVENLAQNSNLVFEDLSKARGRVIKNLRKCVPGRGSSQCKGPEARQCLVCWRNCEEALVGEAE